MSCEPFPDERQSDWTSALDSKPSARAAGAPRSWELEYRSLFEDSKDTIYIGTPEGKLLDINPAGLELFGYSKEELLCLSTDELYVQPADRRRLVRRLQASGYVKDYELALRSSEGRRLTVLETSSVVRNGAGRVVGMRGILRDVTEQRALERHLRHAQRMQAFGQLAGGIAHDFNNLLTAIAGYGELALAEAGCTPQLRDHLQELLAATQRAVALTRQLLALGRKRQSPLRPVNLNRVVTEFENLLRVAAGKRHELVIGLDPALEPIWADPGQIEQVLMNLVVNSRDAMPEGGRILLTTANDSADGERTARLTIEDSGDGMDEETKEKMFDPLFTTKGADRGVGLGLSTVWAIVRDAKGSIEVCSAPGEGTKIDLRFPPVDR